MNVITATEVVNRIVITLLVATTVAVTLDTLSLDQVARVCENNTGSKKICVYYNHTVMYMYCN